MTAIESAARPSFLLGRQRPSVTLAGAALACLLSCAEPITGADGAETGPAPQPESRSGRRIPGVWADTPVERLATGLRFTEGPVWIALRRPTGYVLFSDIPADTIYKWSPEGGLETWRRPSHNSNGLTRDLEGRLLACEHGSRSVTRSRLDGPREAIAERYDGKRLNSPNDIAVKSDGSIYFTDPPYGLKRGKGREIDFDGVYRLDPGTGAVTLVASGFQKPNGLAFSPDESVLYVASSDRKNPIIRAYDVRPDGTLVRERVFYDGTDDGAGGHDGLKVDTKGRVYSSRKGVWVFSPGGEHLGVIPVPEHVANICWGDADWKGLYITARASLYRVRLETPGVPVPPERDVIQHRARYACPLIPDPVSVDGLLDEPAWQTAETIREFSVPVTQEAPVQKTEARLMRDRRHLYVAFKATDPDIWGVLTAHDADTYREDVLEIFFKTDPEGEAYYNFEINPLRTVKDEYHHRVRVGMWHRWRSWDCEGIKTGVKIVGTLNNWEDRDEYWQLEVAIPFASLPSLKDGAPRAGDVWRFHLSRIERSVHLANGRELTSCAPLTERNFHRSKDWLPLVFR